MKNIFKAILLSVLVKPAVGTAQVNAEIFLKFPEEAFSMEGDATYAIVSRFNGKCLDLKDHSHEEGASLQVWDCYGGASQLFKIVDAYKYGWRIQSVESNLKLRIENFSELNGALVEQGFEPVGTSGYFRFYPASKAGAFTIVNTRSVKCMDVEGPSSNNGAAVHQWDCYSGHSSQEWIFIKQ